MTVPKPENKQGKPTANGKAYIVHPGGKVDEVDLPNATMPKIMEMLRQRGLTVGPALAASLPGQPASDGATASPPPTAPVNGGK